MPEYEPLNLFWIGGAEHEGLSLFFRRHSRRAHQLSHVWLKTHIQHSVGFIQHQIANFTQSNLGNTKVKIKLPFTYNHWRFQNISKGLQKCFFK